MYDVSAGNFPGRVSNYANNVSITHFFFFLSFVFCLFGAAPTAYEGSQASGLIEATAAGLHTATATPYLSRVCDLHHDSSAMLDP